jgi:hypothetical protein
MILQELVPRDITPEFFHLTLTNYVGRFEKSFLADIFADYEVWNHPVVGYELREQRKISPEEVMAQYFPDANSTIYSFNEKAKNLMFVKTKMNYVTESDENISGLKEKYTLETLYRYILELDEEENIVGGEWAVGSKEYHPDFIYVPVGNVKSDASILGGIKYSEVKKMIELAQ